MNLQNRAHSNGVHGLAKAKSHMKILLVMIICLLAIPMASAEITLNINAPESVKEGEVLNVDFSASSNTSSNLSQFIFIDDVLVTESSSYSWQTTTSDSGTYAFKFLANSSTESKEEIRNIEVLETPMVVTINTPIAGVTNDDTIRISATPSLEADQCNYTIEGVASGILNKGTGEWFKILLLSSDGIYDLDVACSSSAGGATSNVIFILDTTPPIITSKSPVGNFEGTPVQIEIGTNENSICRYDTVFNIYENMDNTFAQTGGIEHVQIVSVTEQKDYTYYVACQDRHDNDMTSAEQLSFYANLKPTAKISIEGDNEVEDLLKEGTYEIKITTSEPVISPTLEYTLSTGGSAKDILLEGEGTRWSGFLSIPEDTDDAVGSFIFSAKDLTDLVGEEITSGKIFLIDTKKPKPIDQLQVSIQGIDAKLEWLYDGEAIEDFYIFRDTQPNVDRLDKWAETPEEFFVDKEVLLGQRYYYRVAPVDKAGNIGELSGEKSIVVNINATKSTVNPEVLKDLNATQELLRQNIWDLDQIITDLNAESDLAKIEIMNYLGLLSKAKQARTSIDILVKEIEKLKFIGLTEGDARRRIEVFLQSAGNHMKQAAQTITVLDSTRQDQVLREEDLEEAINEVLVGIKLDPIPREEYKQSMKKLQDRTTVNIEAINAKIQYLNNPNIQEITLIHKKVFTEDPVKEALIVESISKDIARRAKDIKFETTPTVLRPDPIVKWEKKDYSGSDIYYHVEKIVDLIHAQGAKTILLEKPNIRPNEITGNVIEKPEEIEGAGFFSKAFLALALITLVSLLVYYVVYMNENNPFNNHLIMPVAKVPQKVQSSPLHHHVKKAHAHADDVRYQEALQLYKGIISALDKHDLNKAEKRTVEEGVEKLYSKIMIINNIEKSHSAIDRKDIKALRDAMIGIKKAYSELGQETELSKHAMVSYNYFLNYLRKIDKEEFFNNLD